MEQKQKEIPSYTVYYMNLNGKRFPVYLHLIFL